MHRYSAFIFVLIFILFSLDLGAQEIYRLQGLLKEKSTGQPLSRSVDATVQLVNGNNATIATFVRTGLSVEEGLFVFDIGESPQLSESNLSDLAGGGIKARVTIDGQQLTPDLPFLSVPYATDALQLTGHTANELRVKYDVFELAQDQFVENTVVDITLASGVPIEPDHDMKLRFWGEIRVEGEKIGISPMSLLVNGEVVQILQIQDSTPSREWKQDFSIERFIRAADVANLVDNNNMIDVTLRVDNDNGGSGQGNNFYISGINTQSSLGPTVPQSFLEVIQIPAE